MDMYDSLFSGGGLLNEQVARQIFEVFPETGPIMVIMDMDGNCWPSDSEGFSKINVNEMFLKELCGRVDDGAEPVVTRYDDFCFFASSLWTHRTNCGYVVMVLDQDSPESVLANTDLVEIIISQVSLIAKLIEKNNLLYELQIKNSNSAYVPEQNQVHLN